MSNYSLGNAREYIETHAKELTFEGLRWLTQNPGFDAQRIFECIEGVVPDVDEPADVNGACVLTYALYSGASNYIKSTYGWDAVIEFQSFWSTSDAYAILERVTVVE